MQKLFAKPITLWGELNPSSLKNPSQCNTSFLPNHTSHTPHLTHKYTHHNEGSHFFHWWTPQVILHEQKEKVVSYLKCKMQTVIQVLQPQKNNKNPFLTHLAKLIIVHFQVLKIIGFLNQIIIIFCQWKSQLSKSMLNHYALNNSNKDSEASSSTQWWSNLNYPLAIYNISKLSTHQ
jgi:hypothetical protein